MKITHIAFDFGGVLTPISLEEAVRRLKALGIADIEKHLNIVRQVGMFGDLESGKHTRESFLEAFREESGNPDVTMEQLQDAFLGFFPYDVPSGNIDILNNLRSRGYRLSLLSNTNPFITHWSMSDRWDGRGHSVAYYMDSMYLSYRLGVMKPDEKIFRIYLEGENVSPENVLYIDDGKDNIEEGSALGMNCILAVPERDWTIDVLDFLKY